MTEGELVECTISEYDSMFACTKGESKESIDDERLVYELARHHDWTTEGARAVLSLANEYGGFMLRNALALAVVLGKEDGDTGF
jgi:hypothetical protein